MHRFVDPGLEAKRRTDGRVAPPNNVRRINQPLHHLVADAPWSDEAVLDQSLNLLLPAILSRGPVVGWVVDDTGFPQKGQHSVGVARQYCGQIGKQENSRVAVSLSITTEMSSMLVAFRLYLLEVRPTTSSSGKPRECLLTFASAPSLKSPSRRFVGRGNGAFRKEWCWPTLATGPTSDSARS